MELIYENQWTAKFRASDPSEITKIIELKKGEWAIGLSGLSRDEIKQAIDYCRINKVNPPNIAEFVAIATQKRNEKNVDASHRLFKPLPRPKGSIEVKRAAIKELKRLLKESSHNKSVKNRFAGIPSKESQELQ